MDFGNLLGGIDVDEVGRAVNFVIQNQDDFGRIIEQFRNMPDGITGFLNQLPEMLQTVGHGPAEAGEQAAQAALSLIRPDGGGARGALTGGANIMTDTKDDLGKAASLLAGPARSHGEGAQTVTGGRQPRPAPPPPA